MVTGLRLRNEGLAEIFLSDVNQRPYVLRLQGIKRLKCDDFLEGNIILELEIAQGRPIESAQIRELFGLDADEKETLVAEQQRLIASGEAMFVRITPSYGCTLLALCAAAELLPE